MKGTLAARMLGMTIVGLLAVTPVSGQGRSEDEQPAEALQGVAEPSGEAWGTSATTIAAISPVAFFGLTRDDEAVREAYSAARYCSDVCFLEAPVVLPNGARITKLEMDAFDSDFSGGVDCTLLRCPIQADSCVALGNVHSGFSATPGAILVSLNLNVTVSNSSNTYVGECYFSGGTSATRLRGVRIFTQLQVSPAPGAATFTDVPAGHWAFQYVEALAASGITAGCGDSSFCPDAAVSRAQMAVFLAKALGLHWPG